MLPIEFAAEIPGRRIPIVLTVILAQSPFQIGDHFFHIRIGNLRFPENRPNSRRVRDVIEIYVDIAAAIDIIVELTLVDIDPRVAQTPIISVEAAAADIYIAVIGIIQPVEHALIVMAFMAMQTGINTPIDSRRKQESWQKAQRIRFAVMVTMLDNGAVLCTGRILR